MTHAIEIKNLEKNIRTGFFGKKIKLLRDVSFSVPSACVFGFVGPNGAGKSTLIKHLLGALNPSEGEIKILGGVPQDRSIRAQIGYLSELPQLPRTLTPVDMMKLHARLSKTSAESDHIDPILKRVGLLHRKDDRIAGFSKGMQQRLGIALALLNKPKLLIFDEPMSGLDPLGRRLVRNIIREAKLAGTTVFFSSHVVSDVEALCDRIALIDKGRLISSGTLREVLGDKSHGVEIDVQLSHAPGPDLQALGEWTSHADFHRLQTKHTIADAVAALAAKGAVIDRVELMRDTLEDRMDALGKESA